MRAYNGFKAQKTGGSGFPQLPVGGYVAKIISAKCENGNWGEQLVVAYDITEGEYASFWKKAYDEDTRPEKKWSGVYYVTVPTGNEEEWQRRGFENLIYAVEESNPRYHWDWNEAGLKGLSFGVLIGEVESLSKDKTRVFTNTRCRGTATVDEIRHGSFQIPKKKEVKVKPVDTSEFTETMDDDGDIPF